MTEPAEDDFTELVDAKFKRIDLVGKGANGLPFLIAKSDDTAGLVPAALVESLINTDRPAAVEKESGQVTVTGAPADIAKMIHDAAVRQVAEPVVKDDDPTDLVEPLADADTVAEDAATTQLVEGDPDDPGSAAWEAVDSARAQQGLDLALGLKRLLEQAQAREAQEDAASGGTDDNAAANVWNISDACSALDFIVSVLAPFAVTEEAEAADRVAAREALMNGQVAKAGRVLSSTNEAAIRSAADSLQKVLASLPAPITDDGQPVAKEEHVNDTTAPAEAPADVAKATDSVGVEKAKGDPQVAVYDSSGNLVGTVDQADLTPIASAKAPEGGDTDDGGDTAADAGDLQPAPADAAGTPVAAAPAAVTKSDDEVLKEMIETQVAAVLQGERAEHASIVKALEDRVAHLEAPAPARVMANGQLPPPHLMRGQDANAGDPQVDVTKAADLRHRLDSATTVTEREAVQKAMNEDASAYLAALRQRSVLDRTAARR